MKKGLMLMSAIIICLSVSSISFADIVLFNNGFTYEGEVKQDAETGNYWIDGALVNKSEIKSIEKKEISAAQSAVKEKKQSWFEGFLASLPFFNKNINTKSDVATAERPSTVNYSSSYSKPAQSTSSQAKTSYSGTSRSVWQNIRRNTNPRSGSGQYNDAGSITKRERNKDLQELKKSSAAYELKAERQKNKSTYGLSRQNSAGYELSRQRALLDRELSSFGGSSTKY